MSDTSAVSRDIINIDNVSKAYAGNNVLNNINLQINSGECIVLIGHNGAGKTTLMKLMLGLTRPTDGQINVLGNNPAFSAKTAQHQSLGYLPESVTFHEAMTGRELMHFYSRLKGLPRTECNHLLELVGLESAANRRIGTYSKGMRQRLGLAQAMLGNPQLLFLDEPTTGLDPQLRQQFYELIEQLHQQGTTSVISSHALNEVEARADRFIIMKTGRIIASGSLHELYQQAALPVQFSLQTADNRAAEIAARLGTHGGISSLEINQVQANRLKLSCDTQHKMQLLRQLTAADSDIVDINIMPPQLDEIYRYFMQVKPQ